MVHPHNSRSAARNVLLFCTMEIILMVFLEEYLIQGSFVILTQTIVRPINPNLSGFFRGSF